MSNSLLETKIINLRMASKDQERFQVGGPVLEIKRPISNLQSRILQDDESLRKKREENKTEMLNRLPQMPHEVEMRKELKDEEELLQLYKEVF